MRILLGLLAATAAAAFIACGGEGEGGEVEVTLTEWSITLDKDSVTEGPVEFTIENTGDLQHELVIIRTDIAPDDLPTRDDGSVDEDAPDLDVERRIEDIEDGDRTGRTYSLEPGAYVLIDNIVDDVDGEEISYYAEGMRAALTVTEDES